MTDQEIYRTAPQHKPPGPAAWRHICRKARQLFPLDQPLWIRRARIKGFDADWCGRYTKSGKIVGHDIRIEKRLSLAATVDAMIHEFAHAWLAEQPEGDAHRDHGDAFWLTFGKFYRAWMEEVERLPKAERLAP